jgi:hypothetical protein
MPSEKNKYKIFTNYRSFNDYIRNDSLECNKTIYGNGSTFKQTTLKGVVDEWDLGKLRTFSDKPNEIYDTWYNTETSIRM